MCAADKLHNAGSIRSDLSVHGERVWKRFNAPREDQLWYYRALVDEFRERCLALQHGGEEHASSELSRLIDELNRVVDEITDTTKVHSSVFA